MKKNLVLAMGLAVAAMALQGCNEKEAAPVEAVAATEQGTADLSSLDNRLSYIIGTNFAGQHGAQNAPFKFNPDAFLAGFKDKAENKVSKVSQEQMTLDLQEFQKSVMEKQQAAQASAAIDNLAAAKAFLEENKTKDGVKVTDSGLQYRVIVAGDGEMPGPTDAVNVHYRGTLIDGAEFDSSYARGEPITFGVNQVIPGWTEALQLMPAGSKWELVIPPALAYGEGGAGEMIGPNAALIFEVELLGFEKASTAEEAPAQ